jgi:NTP pyrophosphatase (non-canonical NTP hydrolase)
MATELDITAGETYLRGRGWLAHCAAEIAEHLHEAGFDPATAVQRQVLALAEEVGEFVGAYRRWSGQARRTGTFADVQAELADVVITAYVTAHELDTAITTKLARVLPVAGATPQPPPHHQE